MLKAIDPTGAALSPGQQAAMAGFATLLGGGLAGLAGANAQAGAMAAQNEVLNNTDKHPEDAAKNGGVLSTLSETFVNALSAFSAARSQGQSQFLQLMQSGANNIMSEPHWMQAAQGAYNGASAAPDAGGGPTAGPDLAPAGPAGGTGQLPSPVASQNSSGNTPSNALLSNGNGDSGSASETGGQKSTDTAVTSNGTANAAAGARLADDLASGMSKPQVSDTKLAGLIDDLYRDGAKIGTGSTADAVRYETETRTPVGGVYHTQKAIDYSTALQRWLDASQTASFSDRSAAQNVLRDLQNALKGK